MAVTHIDWHGFTAWDNGYSTIQVNIPPANVGAQTAFYGQSGGGTNYTGKQAFSPSPQQMAPTTTSISAATGITGHR